jgi:hypothetical protein
VVVGLFPVGVGVRLMVAGSKAGREDRYSLTNICASFAANAAANMRQAERVWAMRSTRLTARKRQNGLRRLHFNEVIDPALLRR